MSEQRAETSATWTSWTIQDLARLQNAQPVADPAEELAGDIWASDEELDAFLADLRTARNSSLA